MSAKEYALDTLTRHQVHLQRYGSSEVKAMMPFMVKMLKDIKAKILTSDSASFARLSILERDVSMIIAASMQSMNKQLLIDLTEFGEYEAGFTQRMLGNIATVEMAGVSVDQVAAAINNTQMSLISGKTTKNLTITQAVNQFSRSTSQTVVQTIQQGIAAGDPTTAIADEVGRIVKNRTPAQAEALIRTAANHAGTQARNKIYEENSDVIEMEQFTAVLDSNTSLACAGNDGKKFEVGEGPMPALHFNCRSVRVPVVADEYTQVKLTGERASNGKDGKQAISGQSTYGGWLRKQGKEFQDDALGPKRADLFRSGGLSIDKFTDSRNATLSLDELRLREPMAFERAGI